MLESTFPRKNINMSTFFSVSFLYISLRFRLHCNIQNEEFPLLPWEISFKCISQCCCIFFFPSSTSIHRWLSTHIYNCVCDFSTSNSMGGRVICFSYNQNKWHNIDSNWNQLNIIQNKVHRYKCIKSSGKNKQTNKSYSSVQCQFVRLTFDPSSVLPDPTRINHFSHF